MPILPIECVLKIVTLKNFDGCTSCMPSSPKEYNKPRVEDTQETPGDTEPQYIMKVVAKLAVGLGEWPQNNNNTEQTNNSPSPPPPPPPKQSRSDPPPPPLPHTPCRVNTHFKTLTFMHRLKPLMCLPAHTHTHTKKHSIFTREGGGWRLFFIKWA